jgi:AcrR family transcriptional regulator/DNA-binding XRE family transcriptional regulator
VSTLGERVRVLRLAQGRSQVDLARRAGLSRSYVSKLERGDLIPRADTLARLREVLAVSGDELSDGTPPARPGGREEIVAAAVALFPSKGYSRVSIRELAGRAGCSTANLYHHFGSKYDIFVTIIEGAMDRHFAGLEEALTAHDEPRAQLRHVLRNHLLIHMTRPEVRLLAEDFHPMEGRELEQFIGERDRYERGVRAIVERGVREGVLGVDDPAVAVRAALSACTSVDRWFRPDGPLSPDTIADRITRFLMTGFAGGAA